MGSVEHVARVVLVGLLWLALMLLEGSYLLIVTVSFAK